MKNLFLDDDLFLDSNESISEKPQKSLFSHSVPAQDFGATNNTSKFDVGNIKKSIFGGYTKKNVDDYFEHFQQSIHQMQSNLERQIKELLKEKENLGNEKRYMEKQVQTLDEKCQELLSQKQSFDEKIEYYETELQKRNKIEEMYNRLKEQYGEMVDENKELVQKFEETNALFHEKEAKYLELTQLRSELENQLTIHLQQLHAVKDENLGLISKLEEKENEITDLKQELEEISEYQEELKEELQMYRNEILEHEALISNQKDEIEELRTKNDQEHLIAQAQYQEALAQHAVQDNGYASQMEELDEKIAMLYETLEKFSMASQNNQIMTTKIIQKELEPIRRRLAQLEEETAPNQDRVQRQKQFQDFKELMKELSFHD